jgi:hypothetical protein
MWNVFISIAKAIGWWFFFTVVVGVILIVLDDFIFLGVLEREKLRTPLQGLLGLAITTGYYVLRKKPRAPNTQV